MSQSQIESSGENLVRVYQTSRLHGDRLTLMKASQFVERGFELEPFQFKEGIELKRPTKFPLGQLVVDSSVVYQV
jgi:hypothetical protein